MIRFALLSAVVVSSALTSGLPPAVTGGLPAGARLVAAVSIPGAFRSYAVAYQTTAPYLAVVTVQGSGATTIWRRKLAGRPEVLQSPGADGLFQGIVKLKHGARFFAFLLNGQTVASAVAQTASGEIAGDEGVKLGSESVTVLNRDTRHVGSVRYQLVTRYVWSNGSYQAATNFRRPDYAAAKLPEPSATFRTRVGDTILVRLQIAATEQAQELGLMYWQSLDADSGMLFVWTQPVDEAFWMHETYIPLSIAFIGKTGRIQEIQDMAPLTETMHWPAQPYLCAMEVNQGFFANNGIQVGDRLKLHGKIAGIFHPCGTS